MPSKIKFIKVANDSLYFGSVVLTLCATLHLGDSSQLLAARGVVDVLHAVGQRVEKRLNDDKHQN
ncbi:hypothetical protein H6F89_33815 [Cyanobacteria bacterium FACHB-63]|nr:hypothetical protein [Cyanobacteria bacterium FACHB-63]